MRFEAGYFRSTDGLDLFFRHWKPEGPSEATVLLVHGLGEHSGRYSDFAAAAVSRGYEVYAMDARGHGRSGGKRGHVDRFEQFVDDLRVFWLRFGPESELPSFLVGQSLGALIGLHYAHRHADDLAGAVFCAGAFHLPENLPRGKILVGRLLRRVLPSLTFGNELNLDCLSPDPKVVEEYLDDPYVHDRVSVSLFFEIERAIQSAPALASQTTLPALFAHGTEDCLLPREGARLVYDRWAGDKRWVDLEGQRHDVFHGPKAAETFETILTWCTTIARPVQEAEVTAG